MSDLYLSKESFPGEGVTEESPAFYASHAVLLLLNRIYQFGQALTPPLDLGAWLEKLSKQYHIAEDLKKAVTTDLEIILQDIKAIIAEGDSIAGKKIYEPLLSALDIAIQDYAKDINKNQLCGMLQDILNGVIAGVQISRSMATEIAQHDEHSMMIEKVYRTLLYLSLVSHMDFIKTMEQQAESSASQYYDIVGQYQKLLQELTSETNYSVNTLEEKLSMMSNDVDDIKQKVSLL